MKIETIREMSTDELGNELDKLKNELFNLRFQHVTGQLENPIKMREVKDRYQRERAESSGITGRRMRHGRTQQKKDQSWCCSQQ